MELRWIRHELVDSTSERAFAELADGRARHGDVHIARGQTAGRGRQGRAWVSASGEGLYASLVLLPSAALSAAGLSMAVGLGVADGLARLGLSRNGRADAHLDWPNDLCVGNAKLAGILIESRGLDPARPHYVVGIGLNVRQREFPAELLAERAVTSLARLGLEVEVEAAAQAVLESVGARLATLVEDPEQLARDYAQGLGLVGRRVEVHVGGGRWKGVLTSLSLDTGLALALDLGREARLPLESITRLAPLGA